MQVQLGAGRVHTANDDPAAPAALTWLDLASSAFTSARMHRRAQQVLAQPECMLAAPAGALAAGLGRALVVFGPLCEVGLVSSAVMRPWLMSARVCRRLLDILAPNQEQGTC
jgi:hypothetical protein